MPMRGGVHLNSNHIGDLFIYLMYNADKAMWAEYCFITNYDPKLTAMFQGPMREAHIEKPWGIFDYHMASVIQ